eukprot:TRINITY_DN7414_c0_g1_i1.p1 TRINITY_DN7414_c0_g1~~TRINITY_DN7414_c0_g1_i1.p1  ORF type:complete len:852 (+),score=147.68 TRINITY_DN7414_c0_g1_i1:64-2619(+)
MACAIAGQHLQEVLLQIQQACQEITVCEQQARRRCRDDDVERWFAEALDNYGLASEYPASYDLKDDIGAPPDIRALLLQAARACESRAVSPKRNSPRRPEGLNAEIFQSPGKNALDPAFASVCSPSKHAKTGAQSSALLDEQVLRVPSPTRAHCLASKPQTSASLDSSLTGTCSGSHPAATMIRQEAEHTENERSTSKSETQAEGTVLRPTQEKPETNKVAGISSAIPHASSGSSVAPERSHQGPRVPAAFAQRPCQEPTEELDSLRPPPSSGPPAWQSSALFAKPPPSPPQDASKTVAESVTKSASGRPPATAQQGLHESQVVCSKPSVAVSGHLGSQSASNKEGAKMPERNQTTPVKTIQEKIQLFERGSTPNQRPLGNNTAGPTPNRLVASASRMSGSVGKSAAMGNPGSAVPGSASAAIDGSSMFTPQQRPPQQVTGEVKPKTLFKSASDAVPKQATNTASRSTASTSATKAPPRPVNAAGSGICSSASAATVGGGGGGLHGSSSTTALPPARDVGSLKTPSLFPSSSQSSIGQSDRLDSSRHAQTDACDRLASGRPRDDVVKPKSIKAAEKAAEQARMQEEKRQRERQEREQEREKTRAANAAAAAAVPSSQSRAPLDPWASSADTQASAPSQTVPAVNPASQAAASGSQARQATAAKVAGIAAAAAAAANDASREASKAGPSRNFPAVPVFTGTPEMPTTIQLLRQIVLQPKNPADNYELSEYDGDSDAEDTSEKDRQRARKRLPAWSENYLDLLQKQADIDPSSIFGEGAPKCNMDEIFPNSLYRLVGKTRPKRARGSSGDWRRDRLTNTEINDYRRKMGQQRNWNDTARPKSSTIGAASSSQH